MPWCSELDEIDLFVQAAKPNTKFLYYVGMSIQDTIISKEIGKKVLEYAKQGSVYLAMKRCLPPGRHFDFDHYMIKASSEPAHSLVPFSDEKVEQLRKNSGVRINGEKQRASKEKRQRERAYRLGYSV